jgi:hypothetical protein
MRKLVICGIAVGTFVFAGASLALDPAPKCQAGKNKEAGKYAFCRQKAEAKAITTGDLADYTKCNEKFFDKWAKAEAKAGTVRCPDEPLDPNSLADFVTEHSNAVATALAGGGLPLGVATCNVDLAACEAKTCGNGVLDPNEDCELGTMNGGTCVGEGFRGGDLGCKAGTCTYDVSGCFDCGGDIDCPDRNPSPPYGGASRNICLNHFCVDGCRFDTDCVLGHICEGNICIEGCRTDRDCDVPKQCIESICQRTCTRNQDCVYDGSPGPVCNTQTHLCVECLTNDNCARYPERPVCDLDTHTCVPI